MNIMRKSDALTPPGLSSFLALSAVSTIVDVGCGSGSFTSYLAAKSSPGSLVLGLDIDPEVLREARLGGGPEWVQADATHLPFIADFSDVVICRRLLMNLPRPIDAVREMVRVVKPGGLVTAIEPDFLGERGFSTVPGEINFLRRILQLTSEGSDLEMGPKTVPLFRQAGLLEINAILHSPVTLNSQEDLPTIHRERSVRRLMELTERWRPEIMGHLGARGYASLRKEAGKLDGKKIQQLEAGEYSSASAFPLWVVKGRKAGG